MKERLLKNIMIMLKVLSGMLGLLMLIVVLSVIVVLITLVFILINGKEEENKIIGYYKDDDNYI